MRKLVLCCCAALTMATFFALPAAAQAQTPAAAQIEALPGAAPEPIVAQGRPDTFPARGNACRIPPPFQPEDCICPLVFEPVCGCDGQTYSNACFARCEVRSFTEGACGGSPEV